MAWQLQEAKQKFSEMIRRALDEGPQTVTRHGDEVAVVLAVDTYRKLIGEVPDFKAYLASAPDLDNLEIHRSVDVARTVEL
jgi:prevent-host-death family protein